MKTTLTRKSKFGNSKQSIISTIKLFHQCFKNAQLLEGEIRRQISDDFDSEIVSRTYQEFIPIVEQTEKIVDVMALSESSQVLEPLEEAEELTTMKIEIMQIVKQHEISMRKETSRASSRSSLRSRMSDVSSNSRKNQQLETGILTTKTTYTFLRKTLLNPQEERKSKPKKLKQQQRLANTICGTGAYQNWAHAQGEEKQLLTHKQLSQFRTSFTRR